MFKSFIVLFTLLACLLETSCISYPVPDYQFSDKNLVLVQNLSKSGRIVSVGSFELNGERKTQYPCSVDGTITTRNGRSFLDLIVQSIRSDLVGGGMPENAPTKLDIHFTKIAYEEHPFRWVINADIRYGNENVSVNSTTDFTASFGSVGTCKDASSNFALASQNFNHQLFLKLTEIRNIKVH